jgi:glycosyltransferase involved in cell wall biosynthesis
MTGPTFTVLIDTYNYQRFIERAIDSALAQTYPASRVEILVVDDGSTDATEDVVRRYGTRVRYLRKSKGGQASSLNLGFKYSGADIICLLDADDYFYPDKLASVAEAATQSPEAGLIYNEFDIVCDGAIWPKTYPEPTWTGNKLPLAAVKAGIQDLILLGHPWTCITSAMSIRREVAQGVRIPEKEFPHSPDLFLGLVLPFVTGIEIVATPMTGYVYHGANLGLFRSSAANRALYRKQLDVCRRHVEKEHGKRFLSYAGRGIYRSDAPAPVGLGARLSSYAQEGQQIVRAHVPLSIKLRSNAKLLASCALPDRAYSSLHHLRSRMKSRSFLTKSRSTSIPEKVGG